MQKNLNTISTDGGGGGCSIVILERVCGGGIMLKLAPAPVVMPN